MERFLETVGTSKNAFTRSMRHPYGPPVACEKGYHSRSLLPKSAALVAVDCDDHALAKGLAIVVDSIVGRIASGLYTFRSACRL
jgi:hypothetical protein